MSQQISWVDTRVDGRKSRPQLHRFKEKLRAMSRRQVFLAIGGMFLATLTMFGGMSLIIQGSLIQTKFKIYWAIIGDGLSLAPILSTVAGFITTISIISLFGYCLKAACSEYKENYRIVTMLAVFLCITFVIEIAAAVYSFNTQNEIEEFAKVSLSVNMYRYKYHGDPDAATDTWDQIQMRYSCCGVNGPHDWENVNASEGKNIPMSCCRYDITVSLENCGRNQIPILDRSRIFTKGCLFGFVSWIEDNMYTIFCTNIAAASIQIFGIIAAFCWVRSIRNKGEKQDTIPIEPGRF